MLYIVPTPIGNLKDITTRAIEVLSSVDVILCEDTRKTKILLNHFNISKPLIAYHKFNERKSCDNIISMLKEGKEIALVSDSGTPLISDPGQILVEQLNQNQLPYTALPGACALVTALVLSGFDSAHFSFFGFLPEKSSTRKKLLEEIKNYTTTLIFHISVHSLEKDLEFLKSILGERKACLVREISKIYEEKIFFTLGEQIDVTEKGEFVLIVQGQNQTPQPQEISVSEELEKLINSGLTKNQAISNIAKKLSVPRNELYKKINNID